MARFRYVKTYGSYGEPSTVAFRRSSSSCDMGKTAYDVRVIQGKKVVWDPKSPLCVPPSAKPKRIVEDAMGFYEHDRDSRGLHGSRRRRKRRR